MRRDFDTTDDKILARAEVEAAHYLANLEYESVEYHPRKWAAEALIVLGKLHQAYELVVGHPELAGLAQEIKEIREALPKPDGERCECKNIIEGIQFPNYTRGRRVFSQQHGVMARVHKCNNCGHVNAFPGHADDLHATAHSHRQSTEKVFQKPGKGTPPQTPDAILLKNASASTN